MRLFFWIKIAASFIPAGDGSRHRSKERAKLLKGNGAMTYADYRRRLEIDNYKKTQLIKLVQKTRIHTPCACRCCCNRMYRGSHGR